MKVNDLGQLPYRDAWAIQESAHAVVLAGGEEQLILVEHSPVITFGRRAAIEGRKHLLLSESEIASRGVELVDSDRGGDVTFHGPGQIVAYPIIRLADHRLSIGGYVRTLEQMVIDTLATFGIIAMKDESAIGVWTRRPSDGALAKICALGVRIRRGVSLHGIALNVETDLSQFELIVPCGLQGRPVTSMRTILGPATPSIATAKSKLVDQMRQAFRGTGSADFSRQSTSGTV